MAEMSFTHSTNQSREDGVVVACPECSSSHPIDQLADHLRGHWQTRVDQLEARIKQFEQQPQHQQLDRTLEMKLPTESAPSPTTTSGKLTDMSEKGVIDESDDRMVIDDEEEVDEGDAERYKKNISDLRAECPWVSFTPSEVAAEDARRALEIEEDDWGVTGSTGDLDQLMDSATDTTRPPPSHFTSIPSEVLFENDPDGVDEANELINNPDSRETILEDVLDQLDHIPESLRTILEDLLVQHNADDHPLKYCSVEEFHSMVDSHLHPSGGGEYEYVGKLVQQLESALKLSQAELANYMKTKELDFNEMGPFMIEQKRIKEELIKQRAILFPLESPLWQACINYLKETRTDAMNHDVPLQTPPLDTLLPSFHPSPVSNSAAGTVATEESEATSQPVQMDVTSITDTCNSMSTNGINGLDGVMATAVDSQLRITSSDDLTEDDPYILPGSDPTAPMDEDEVVDELLDELDEDRFGRYQWMCEQINEYHRVKAGPGLIWGDVQAFLIETTFIGEEVKEMIQLLFTQPNFTILPDSGVLEWSGWNFVNLKSDAYVRLDPSLPQNRKLLRALDALIDCLIELADGELELVDELGDESRRMGWIGEQLSKLVPVHGRATESSDTFGERVDAFQTSLNQSNCRLSEEVNMQLRSQLTELLTDVKVRLKLDTDLSSKDRALKENVLLNLRVTLEQRRTETIIPRQNMELLIRESLQNFLDDSERHQIFTYQGIDFDFTPEAIDALHLAAEDYLIKQFDTAANDMRSMTNVFLLICDRCHRSIPRLDQKYQCQQCPEFYCQ